MLLGRALRSVLHSEQDSYYHRLLSHIKVHSHYSPNGRADLSHRCSLATLTRSVCRRSFPAVGYGNTAWRSDVGTRECRNVKPLRLRDTALAVLDGVCSNSDAAHRFRFATHSFNGWRCCPTPPFAQTLLGKSYAYALHSHVASKHRCCIDYSRCAVRRGTNSIAPMLAYVPLISSFVRAVLTWRHRTVTPTRQAGRRHFFGGIATNCLNNSKSAPLSPSSSPLRTASSSPHGAVISLAFGKRAVLPWATKSASRFCHARQLIHRTSLAYSARILRARSANI